MAASLSLRARTLGWRAIDWAGRPSEGERWPILPVRQAGRRAVSGQHCRAIISQGESRFAERGPAPDRLEMQLVFDCIEFKCENAKLSCIKHNYSAAMPATMRPLRSVRIDALQQPVQNIPSGAQQRWTAWAALP